MPNSIYKQEKNPTFISPNSADCASCGNFRKGATPEMYCSEYVIEPPFECAKHTNPRQPKQIVIHQQKGDS